MANLLQCVQTRHTNHTASGIQNRRIERYGARSNANPYKRMPTHPVHRSVFAAAMISSRVRRSMRRLRAREIYANRPTAIDMKEIARIARSTDGINGGGIGLNQNEIVRICGMVIEEWSLRHVLSAPHVDESVVIRPDIEFIEECEERTR